MVKVKKLAALVLALCMALSLASVAFADEPDYTYITAKALQDACNADKFDYKKLVDDLIADGFFIPSDKIKKGRKTPPATVQKKIGKVNVECYRIPSTAFDDDK